MINKIKINKMEIIENDCVINVENKKYYIHESFLLNGTGYTFRIYANKKHSRDRNNCFSNYKYIIIIGDKYNYLLSRIDDKLEYDITEFEKNILTFELKRNSKYPILSIYLNDDELFSYGYNDNFNNIWQKEIDKRTKIVRKQKLIKIQNEGILSKSKL